MNHKTIIFIVIHVLISLNILCQHNTDSIYNSAIEYSRRDNFDNAIVLAKTAYYNEPSRDDICVFIGNLYSWMSLYDSAKFYLDKAYTINPRSHELYDSWLNVLLWNGEYEELLRKSILAESNGYSNKYNLFLKRIIAYKSLGKFREAMLLITDKKVNIYNDSINAANIIREILMLYRQNILSAYYSLDYLKNYSPAIQHLAYLDYAIGIKKSSLIPRLNYAERFNKKDFQAEIDYYQVFKSRKFLYFNYGYSIQKNLFPLHRAGLEYYSPMRENSEISLGGRYLVFADSKATIITASLLYYFNHLWVNVRPFCSFSSSGNSISFVTDLRVYGKSAINYWNIQLGYGNSPDERFMLNQTSRNFQMNSYKVRLSRNLLINKFDEVKLSLGYSLEEGDTENSATNRYTFEILYGFRLR